MLLLGSGCGFQRTEPVSNVCELLTLAEVHSLAPALTTATEQPPVDSPDLWRRSCQFSAPGIGTRVGLGVSGALTSRGDQELDADVSGAPIPEFTVTVLGGIGDRAVYTNYRGEQQGLTAKQGTHEVGVGVINGPGSLDQLVPLVTSVLVRLR
jgi:hypothetical protein